MANKTCQGCSAKMDIDAIFCNECGLAAVASDIRIDLDANPVAGARASFREVRHEDSPPGVNPRSGHSSNPFEVSGFHESKNCGACGAQNELHATRCGNCLQDFRTVGANFAVGAKFEQAPATPRPFIERDVEGSLPSAIVDSVKRRYRDAYGYARVAEGIGLTVQILAICAAIIAAVVGLIIGGVIEAALAATRDSAFGLGPGPGLGAVIGFAIIALSIAFGAVLWILGLVIKASAQMIKASLDGAVNSSPFLSDTDRAHVMSLL